MCIFRLRNTVEKFNNLGNNKNKKSVQVVKEDS